MKMILKENNQNKVIQLQNQLWIAKTILKNHQQIMALKKKQHW